MNAYVRAKSTNISGIYLQIVGKRQPSPSPRATPDAITYALVTVHVRCQLCELTAPSTHGMYGMFNAAADGGSLPHDKRGDAAVCGGKVRGVAWRTSLRMCVHASMCMCECVCGTYMENDKVRTVFRRKCVLSQTLLYGHKRTQNPTQICLVFFLESKT
jgi:hypothetical protein